MFGVVLNYLIPDKILGYLLTMVACADGGNDGRSHDRSDPWNLPDAGTTQIGGGDPFQLEAESFNLVLDCLP